MCWLPFNSVILLTGQMQGIPQTPGTTTIVIQAQAPQLIQQQHQQQQQIQENEQFALSWLRSNYEPASGATVDQNEMYHHYINSSTKVGRRGVVTSYHFPRFVRYVSETHCSLNTIC